MTRRVYDDSFAVFVRYHRVRTETASGWYAIGFVRRVEGLVGVYEEFDHVRLEMVHDGRQYERRHDYGMSDRGIVTAAGRFARDVIAGRIA